MKLRMIRTFTRNYSVQRNFPAIIGHSAGTRKYPCIICMIESCMIFGLSMVEIKIKKKKKKEGKRKEKEGERNTMENGRFVMFRDVIKSFVYITNVDRETW